MNSDEIERHAMELLAQAFEHSSDSREAWLRQQTQGQEALFLRVMELLAAERAQSYGLKTGTASQQFEEPSIPARAGAYKIVERLGYGGMGAVYKGERDANDFEHTVAIKVIRPGILSEALMERFSRERQTLAKLSHPNIARLYDGGQLEDGSPYIIMEYVEGEGLLEWCSGNKTSLKERLDLFSTVCEAVRHAHQNLIIHRDITPSNVMVDPEGQVKLIDFGIAKPNEQDHLNASSTEDLHASMSFTPGYAAPERRVGAPASTLTDIYSLGKLLEDLLSEFFVDEDLQAIIKKASMIEQTERYASVDMLLEDIVHFTQERPVNAFSGGARYQLYKYYKRHKFALSSACFAVFCLIAGLITTSVLYRNAETQKNIATHRFNDVRDLAEFMMFDLYDEVADLPRSTSTRKKMADFSQRYIEDLSNSERADLDLRLDTIEGWLRLGDIQGNARYANLGEVSEAMASYDRAEAGIARLDNQDLERWDVRFLKNLVLRKRAEMAIYKDLDMSKARTLGEQAAQEFEALSRLGNEEQTASADAERISTLLMVADAQNKMNQPELSLENLDIAETLNRQLTPQETYLNDRQKRWLAYAQPMITFRRAEALYGLGVMNKTSHSDPAAEPYASESIDHIKRAMEEFDDLSQRYPEWRRLQRNQVTAPWLLGNLLSELFRFDEADKYLDTALQQAQTFANSDPEDSEAAQLVSAVRSTRAYFKAYAMKSYEGINELRSMTQDAEARALNRPDDPRAQIMSLVLLRPTADALWHQERQSEACDAYRLAQQKYDKAAQTITLPADFVNNDVTTVEKQLILCAEQCAVDANSC